jgi:hypothetical protein
MYNNDSSSSSIVCSSIRHKVALLECALIPSCLAGPAKIRILPCEFVQRASRCIDRT